MMYLGPRKVSCLWRCPQFRGVLIYRGVPLYLVLSLIFSGPGNGNIVLESAQHRSQHVGVLPDGVIKEPAQTGTGQHAQFRVIEHKKAGVRPFSS